MCTYKYKQTDILTLISVSTASTILLYISILAMSEYVDAITLKFWIISFIKKKFWIISFIKKKLLIFMAYVYERIILKSILNLANYNNISLII